jgi:UPF0755 protein
MNEKKQKILLGAIILVICLITVFFIIYFGILIPNAIGNVFGPADPALDNSSRIIYSIKLFFNQRSLNTPVGSSGTNRIFVIETGRTADEIVDDLAQAQLIKDPGAFRNYLIYKGIDRQLQAGVYILNPTLTPIEIAELLYDTTPEDIVFSFLAGWRAEEIAALLPTSGMTISPDDFLNLIEDPPIELTETIFPGLNTLEGYLFPGQYRVLKSAKGLEFISQILNNFLSQLPENYQLGLEASNLNLNQAIILASIIEKESILPEEAPLIASVFINRLNAGMPLQSDPTVQYAIGYSEEQKSWWKNPLSSSDLSAISPYNTYLNKGLPPAPICNPGLISIKAVLNPADTNYLFFRAACDGSGRHIFNILYEDHLKAECK